MVSPCRGSIWVLILQSLGVALHAIMPLPLVEFPSQTFSSSYLLNLLLDVFDGLLQQFTTLFHHVDFSAILRVRLQ
jgi:hypothetical protein